MAGDARMIEGPGTWTGGKMMDNDRWRFRLTEGEIAEIDAALAGLRSRNVNWFDVTRETFPLSALADTLARISDELENGSGLAQLSGLPVERYDESDRRRLWWGRGQYLGRPVYQDFQGQLMRDITDASEDTDARYGHQLKARDGAAFVSSKARTLTSGALRYHTDRCDVVALFCVHAAASGGVNRIANIAAIHNLIGERRPDLLELLYQPYTRSRLGEEQGGENETYDLPVFGVVDGKLTSHYSRTYIEAAQEMPGVATLTEDHWAALDMLAQVADEVALEMTLAPGDMQFLNNHAVYHARTAYSDPPDGPGRLMHRLWLAMPNSRRLPNDHAVLWGRVAAGALRGGIGQADAVHPPNS